jgi:hypothetical protein
LPGQLTVGVKKDEKRLLDEVYAWVAANLPSQQAITERVTWMELTKPMRKPKATWSPGSPLTLNIEMSPMSRAAQGCRLPGRKRIVDMVTLRINDCFSWGAARLNQHGETSRLARAVRPTAPQGS